jgi:hypothetical protein
MTDVTVIVPSKLRTVDIALEDRSIEVVSHDVPDRHVTQGIDCLFYYFGRQG